MSNEIETLRIESWWILVMLLGYAFAGWSFIKTDSIFIAASAIIIWMSSTAYLIHCYYS